MITRAALRNRLAPVRDRVTGLPLRVRLAVAVTVIALVGLVGAGAATLTALRSYLIGRIDSDLSRFVATSASGPDSFGRLAGGPGADSGRQIAGCGPHNLPSEFYVRHVSGNGGAYQCSSPLGQESPPDLGALTAERVRRLDGTPFTARSVNGRGDWRVVMTTTPDGDLTAFAESLNSTDSTVNRLLLLEIGVGLVVLVLMAGAGYFVVRRSLRPLTEVEGIAAAIARGELSRRVPPGDERTEVGRLAAALNLMLAQIENAFSARARSERQARASEERMRQFVADASHELRTPLTSIRGFAELYRIGGAGTDEADVRRLMSRIETESTRMGGLVQDLLLLARLDEKRPLSREPVDLSVVASDVVHDAHALAPQRAISLTAPGPVVVPGDEQRLRQVVHNLVGNALTHTPAGTPVEVVVQAPAGNATDEPPEARITVTDHGPGIRPEQAEQVFERFWRADAARTREAGGAGLGLAIVTEIVAAHGGRVAVVPTPGGGATFTVALPAVTAAVGAKAAGGD